MALKEYSTTDILKESGAAGQKVERKLLITYVNAAAFGTNYSTSPDWVAVGKGVEDSSIEYNPDTQKVTDIMGITETTVNKLEMSQSFDPMTLRKGSKVHTKIIDIIERAALSELSLFECMVVRAYMEESVAGATQADPDTVAYHAEIHKNCTITPQSEGGSSHVDMPISIDFSGDKKLGTVDSLTDPAFTELSGAEPVEQPVEQ